MPSTSSICWRATSSTTTCPTARVPQRAAHDLAQRRPRRRQLEARRGAGAGARSARADADAGTSAARPLVPVRLSTAPRQPRCAPELVIGPSAARADAIRRCGSGDRAVTAETAICHRSQRSSRTPIRSPPHAAPAEPDPHWAAGCRKGNPGRAPARRLLAAVHLHRRDAARARQGRHRARQGRQGAHGRRRAGARRADPGDGRRAARCRRHPDGFILDGFPRTTAQAEALDEQLQREGRRITAALLLEVPDAEIVKRIAGRRVCVKAGSTTITSTTTRRSTTASATRTARP